MFFLYSHVHPDQERGMMALASVIQLLEHCPMY